MSTPTIPQLKHAITLSEQIEKLQAELASLLGGSGRVSAPVKAAPVAKAKKGGMSAEGKARIAAAQKARWAKIKAGQPAAATAAAPKKKKRKISAAHRAKLAAAAKARWARVKQGSK